MGNKLCGNRRADTTTTASGTGVTTLSTPLYTIRAVTWNVLAHEFTSHNTATKKKETTVERDARWAISRTWLQHGTGIATRHDGSDGAVIPYDIILLQEATQPFLAYLLGTDEKKDDTDGQAAVASSLPLRDYESLWHARAPATPDGCAIVYRGNQYTVMSHRFLPFTAGTKRGAYLALLADRRHPHGYIGVASIHLEGAPLAHDIRQLQMTETVVQLVRLCDDALAAAYHKDATFDIIIGGDFNHALTHISLMDDSVQRAMDQLASSSRTTPSIALHMVPFLRRMPYGNDTATFIPTPNTPIVKVFEDAKAVASDKALDHLYVTSSLHATQPLRVVPAAGDGDMSSPALLQPVYTTTESWPSDHLALRVTLARMVPAWPPQPPPTAAVAAPSKL